MRRRCASATFPTRKLLRQPKFESLEVRTLFSITGSTEFLKNLLPWSGGDVAVTGSYAAADYSANPLFEGEAIGPLLSATTTGDARSGPDRIEPFQPIGTQQTAALSFVFPEQPTVQWYGAGAWVTLAGEQTWLSPGEPVVPVRSAAIALPQFSELVGLEVQYRGQGISLAKDIDAFLAPAAVAIGAGPLSDESVSPWQIVSRDSWRDFQTVRYQTHTYRGYQILTLQVFPVSYDEASKGLVYHDEIDLSLTVAHPRGVDLVATQRSNNSLIDYSPPSLAANLGVRGLAKDRALVAAMVANPEILQTYEPVQVLPLAQLPESGRYEYVVVTSAALEPTFAQLVAHKRARGISARVVTTEYIAAHYSGTETGDLADRIRQFITEAYLHWGTQWVLLGGDTEIIPERGVLVQVGSTIDTKLATDLYYACLDGPWNGDADGIWGEPTDGLGGRDIDLAPEVFIGRAPVSTVAEAGHFVRKTILYETTPHPNRLTALWLGERLDSQTEASYSGNIIRDRTVPDGWNLIERYDATGGWAGSQLIQDLNQNPHLINHLGHSNVGYNARLYTADVARLQNSFPYFVYSQGCLSGGFDLRDVAIGEQHVVGATGAFAVIMNSRYGWYVPGNVPGASHFYALEFWDAVFNEGLHHVGLANHDSKIDNLFRVQTTGVYRWIHMETNLLGDPETPLQITSTPSISPWQIAGRVAEDLNRDSQVQPSEPGIGGVPVWLDFNGDGRWNQGSYAVVADHLPTAIPDAAILRSTVELPNWGRVTDLSVSLDLTHNYLNDLEVYLISPAGTRVQLFSRLPAANGRLANVRFDDQSSRPIHLGSPVFEGTYRPGEPLSRFYGESMGGRWVLEIRDVNLMDTGTLTAWTVEVGYAEPSVQTDASGYFRFTGLVTGDYTLRVGPPVGWQVISPASGYYQIGLTESNSGWQGDFSLVRHRWPPEAVDWGTLAYRSVADAGISEQGTWYRLVSSRSGYLTIEAKSKQGTGNFEISLHDKDGGLLARARSDGGLARVDYVTTRQEELYFLVRGRSEPVRLVAANLVAVSGSTVGIAGTTGDDRFRFRVGEQCELTINDLTYRFDTAAFSRYVLAGADGTDGLVLEGSAASERLTASGSTIRFLGGRWSFVATEVENLLARSHGGNDVAWVYDSPGNDRLVASPNKAELWHPNQYFCLEGFKSVHVLGVNSGQDEARLTDSPANDIFLATPNYAVLYNPNFQIRVVGFDKVVASSTAGGTDSAYLYDGAGDDVFLATPQYGVLSGAGYENRAVGFRFVVAFASTGQDVAKLYDSAGADTLYATPTYVVLSGSGFYLKANRFRHVSATASSGADLAKLYDSSGDDFLRITPSYSQLSGAGYNVVAKGFGRVRAYASAGGNDDAVLVGSDRSPNILRASGSWLALQNADLDSQLSGFRRIRVNGANTVGSRAVIYDSPLDDLLFASRNVSRVTNRLFSLWIEDFAVVQAHARNGGENRLQLGDIDYLLETTGNWRFV